MKHRHDSLPEKNKHPLLLLVDDIPENLKILRGKIASFKCRLTFAMNGVQAIERATETLPDLILLDLMMPGMNGLDVCKQLKQNPATTDIHVIFLTASNDVSHLQQAFAVGAGDYVTKPFRAEELIARITNHLELAKLRHQAQLKAQQESILRELVTEIHGSLQLKHILSTTVNNLQNLLSADRIAIARYPSSKDPVIVASTDTALQNANYPIAAPLDHQPYICSTTHPHHLTLSDRDWFQRCHIEAEYRLPIIQDSQLWGILLIHAQEAMLNAMNLELLEPVISQLIIAIQQSNLHHSLKLANAELKRLSNLDGLTKIANRRALDDYLDREYRRLQREQQSISIIMVDIDYFKLYNDTYGHPQGDQCLIKVAQLLQRSVNRPTDFVARYGGEEFTIVLPNTDAPGAIYLARQIQKNLANLELEHSTHRSSDRITVSMGVASSIPEVGTSYHEIILAADAALFQAKEQGRNCICCANEEMAQLLALNVEAGLERCDHDAQLYQELLDVFLQTHANFESQLQSAQQLGDRNLSFYLVNILRGGSTNIGAKTLERLIIGVEQQLKTHTLDHVDLEDDVKRLISELNRVRYAIQAFKRSTLQTQDPSPLLS
jgi:two-component system, cell cycle response regulator